MSRDQLFEIPPVPNLAPGWRRVVKGGVLPEYYLPVLVVLRHHTGSVNDLHPKSETRVAVGYLVPHTDGFGDKVPQLWYLLSQTSAGRDDNLHRYDSKPGMHVSLTDVGSWCHIPPFTVTS